MEKNAQLVDLLCQLVAYLGASTVGVVDEIIIQGNAHLDPPVIP